MDARTSGAKQAVQNMLYYYLIALKDEKVQDPKRVIATELGEMIDLSEEQVDYVVASLNDGSRLTENLSKCVELLRGMLSAGTLDKDAVNIVVQILELTNDNIRQILESQEVEDGQGQKETS